MSKDFDEINPDHIEGEPEGQLLKWMSILILFLAVGGFFALAWYAYHTGTNQSEVVQAEENLDLVKADAEPLKETPQDPGGQQFPHQDKTVFNAISGDDKQPVERILPASEEPVEHADKAETETWMNNSLAKKEVTTPSQPDDKPENADAKPEAIASEEPAGTPSTQFDPSSVRNNADNVAAVTPEKAADPAPQKMEEKQPEKAPVMARVPDIESAGPTKSKAAALTIQNKINEAKAREIQAKEAQIKAAAVPVKEVKVAAVEPAAAAPVDKKPNGVRAQLGAFKSQEEAESTWNSIRSRIASKLDGKEHRVLRVDLGAKGIFYRLHVLPFASAGNAQSFCGSISPQPCFVVGK